MDANPVTLAPNQGIASLADYLKGADLQRHCGTLAHKYMEMLATTDLALWDAARLQQCQPAMQKWLIQQAHAAVPAQQGAAQVLAALQATLNSEAGRWVLQPHAHAVSELSLMQAQEEEAQSSVHNHVIDRTFVENGVRWIVDYKLTQLDENIDFTEAAKQHRPQLERYAGLFANEGLPIKKAVLFLSKGILVEL